MQTFELENIAYDAAQMLRARLTDATSATVAEMPLSDDGTPGDYSGSTTYDVGVNYPLEYEVRKVTAQTSAAFDAGDSVEGPALYDSGPVVPANAGGVSQRATINPGGTVSMRRTLRVGGAAQDFDAAPTCTLRLDGAVVSSTTTSDAYIAITHVTGSGLYAALATVTGSAAGQSGVLTIGGLVDGVYREWSVEFTVVEMIATAFVSPLVAQGNAKLYVTRDLPQVPAGSAPAFAWTVADAAGDAVDLSAKTVRLVVGQLVAVNAELPDSDPWNQAATPLFKYETGGSGVTVGGVDHNVVTVQLRAADTVTAGKRRYWLLNATDKVVLATGLLPIVPAALDYP